MSIRQPWAWLICAGTKKIENRTWRTDFRGIIAIHASTSHSLVQEYLSATESVKLDFKKDDFAYGAIVGLVELVDIQVYGREHESDCFATGPYCWRLAKPRLLKNPIPANAKQNLFALDDEQSAKVLAAATTVLDLGSDSREAILARWFTRKSDPLAHYNHAISELEGTIADGHLAKMASRMIELAPENPLGYMHRISLQDSSSSEEIAKADFEKLVDIVDGLSSDKDEDLELTLSFCASQLSEEAREETASKFWRRLIAVDDENAWYRRGLGWSLLSISEKQTEALIELELAIKLAEEDEYDQADMAYLLSSLAEGYRRNSELDRAKATVDEAMRLDRAFPDAIYVAAKITLDQGDKNSARQLLNKTLKIDPEHIDAMELIKEIN